VGDGARKLLSLTSVCRRNALSLLRRVVGKIIRVFGTDPNRRSREIIDGAPGVGVVRDEASLLGATIFDDIVGELPGERRVAIKQVH
jgi:hypothetical protein